VPLVLGDLSEGAWRKLLWKSWEDLGLLDEWDCR
jgi:hypothetical protein